MRFFEELSGDSHQWEILGVRKVSVSKHPEELLGEFFCISDKDPMTGRAHRVKSFTSPIDNIRHFKAGSLWKDGKNISPPDLSRNNSFYQIYDTELVLAQEPHASTQEVIKRILDSNTPHRTFMSFTNHVKFSRRTSTGYIQCSEIVRHFMAPSKRFLRAVLNGTIDEHFRSAKENKPSIIMPNMTSKELLATESLSYNHEGLRSVRSPYKNLKLTTISNSMDNQASPLLLTSLFPNNSIKIEFRRIEVPFELGSSVNEFVGVQIKKTDYLQRYFRDWL